MKLFSTLVVAAVAVVSAQQEIHDDHSFRAELESDANPGLEMFKEHHQRRMAKLEELIEKRRQLVQEHEIGRRKLSEEEYSRASKQVTNFQRKLEQMKKENDEDHIQSTEEIRSMHKRGTMDL